MTAPGNIGQPGSGRMANINLYDNEFPLLKVNGLYAALTSGDGDCLFHSLSDQLYGHENSHMELRQRVVQHLRNHASYFKVFIDVQPVRRAPRRRAAASHKSDLEHHSQAEIDKAYEERLLRMANKGVFGDNLEIQAFAREFDVNVKIYQRENAYVICPDNTAGSKLSDDNRTTVHIAYHIWEHYSSIRNRDGPHSGPPCVREQRSITEREKKQLLDGASAILPWMEDVVAASIPQYETPERIREVLEQCKGGVDEAVKFLQDEWDLASNFDTESTAPDYGDDYQRVVPDFDDEEDLRTENVQLVELIEDKKEEPRAIIQEIPRPDIKAMSQPGFRAPTVQPVAPPAVRVEVQPAVQPVVLQPVVQPVIETIAPAKVKADFPSSKAQPTTRTKMVDEAMLDAPALIQDVPFPIQVTVEATTQKPDSNVDEYSGAKRRKSPDGSPVRVTAAQNNSSSDETSSAGSSGSSMSDNNDRRRRKPARKSTVSAQPTRRSPRIQAKAITAAQEAAARAAAPPPPPPTPKNTRTPRKPRANAATKKKTPATTRKRGGAGIGMVTVGIKELYV